MIREAIKKFYYRIYLKIFPSYFNEIEKELKGCQSILDVGCGENSPIEKISNNCYSVGVDIHRPSLEKSKKKGIHNKYVCINILDIKKKFKNGQFDCVIASDVIEHLRKKDGFRLLKSMEYIAKKKIIVYTPNGYLEQENLSNPYMEHKSGWSYNEMQELGYRVIGISGIKLFKGGYFSLAEGKKANWILLFLSDLTQKFFTKNNAKYAFRIMCIKKK